MTENRTLSVIKEFGSLINSGLILVAACGLVYKWGSDTNAVNSRISANTDAIAKLVIEDGRRWDVHAELHKERSNDIAKRDGSVDARLSQLEQSMEMDGRKLDNGIYRIGILEDARKGDAAIIRDVQKTVNELAGDLRVVRQSVERQDNQLSRTR